MKKITKKTKIVLELLTCQECPFFEKDRYYTEDSFEVAFNWYCCKVKEEGKSKKIAGYVEWHEENKTPVPDWCPIKLNDEVNIVGMIDIDDGAEDILG